jgi:hypothetical protein
MEEIAKEKEAEEQRKKAEDLKAGDSNMIDTTGKGGKTAPGGFTKVDYRSK